MENLSNALCISIDIFGFAIKMQGGWEIDESLEEAASRETFEEAGVVGEVEVQVRFCMRR